MHVVEPNPFASPGEASFTPDRRLRGVLYAFVAFDWGDEIDYETAKALAPSAPHELSRRRRTPLSIAYRPAPLRLPLGKVSLELPEIGVQEMTAEALVFDFAAVSVSLRCAFDLTAGQVTRLANGLSNPERVLAAARRAVQPLFDRLLPALQSPLWSDLTEEFFVFALPPHELDAETALTQGREWLAGVVRLEEQPLCREEVEEALKLQIRYGRDDLLVADWAAAVLIDVDCSETLDIVEFTNLQLLEFREMDNRLGDQMAATANLVHGLARRRLLPWRPYTVQLRALGDLKVEANAVFERAQNVLKLVGDQYLARVYRLLAARFYLEQWQASVQRSLDVLEGAYRVLADQTALWRAELLEWIIILLIAVEVFLTLVRY